MYSRYGTWVFPKGGIEAGEAPEAAARREVAEEIGLEDLKGHGRLGTTKHEFEQGNRQYSKRVDWFLFEAAADAEPRSHPEENAMDAGWFDPNRALSLLSHADQRRILRRALSMARR
jgi:diadenosine hexaphosphate hydrolase (ATP-forming)